MLMWEVSLHVCDSNRDDTSHYEPASRVKVCSTSYPQNPNGSLCPSVIAELIIGYMLPGRPIAMMLFKTWGYITMAQGMIDNLISSLKCSRLWSLDFFFRLQTWTVSVLLLPCHKFEVNLCKLHEDTPENHVFRPSTYPSFCPNLTVSDDHRLFAP